MNKLKNISTFILLLTTVFFSACSIEPFEGTIPDPNAPVDPVDPALLPTLLTTNYSNLTTTSATSGGTVTTDGGSAVIARGVVWNTTANPTIANSKTTDGTGTGNFTSSITGLTAGTTYYVRAYATNSSGTGYGSQITFTTTSNPSNFPVVTTTVASAVTSSSAASGGNVTADGGSPVTSRGVVWSTTAGPTTANSKTVDGTGTGSFTSAISGLAGSTVYYVRAYATNANGTAYGNQITFTTPAGSVSTGPAMTAKINGVSFQANNPFGNNLYSSTNIWDYFPLADYVMLQGRQGGVLGNPEINIWLKRTDMVVGTYNFGKETFSTPLSHFIDLIDNSNAVSENTVQGAITITEVNTTTKMVKGTFSFTTTDDLSPAVPVVNYTVSEGTFNYKYMD